MSDLMKYNAILAVDDDYHLWYDSLKGWRLNIRGVGNSPFNLEAEVLFEIERERIIKLLREKAIDLKRISESIDEDEYMNAGDGDAPYWGSFALDDFADALIKGENK